MTQARYPDDDDSEQHVRQLKPSVDGHRSYPRRLRLTYEPTDLSEIVVEHTSLNGHPINDARNRVLLLEHSDLVWLDQVLHPIAEKLRGQPPVSGTFLSSSKSHGMTVTLGDLMSKKPR